MDRDAVAVGAPAPHGMEQLVADDVVDDPDRGAAVHLGADPGAASVYDTALVAMNMGVLSGFYQAIALVSAAGVDTPTFAAVAVDRTAQRRRTRRAVREGDDRPEGDGYREVGAHGELATHR